MSKQKGNHTAALKKYKDYILDLVEVNHLHYPYHLINLKNKLLQEKYHLSFPRSYSVMIQTLLEVGWIVDVGDYFRSDKAKFYNLSLQFIIDNGLMLSFDRPYISYYDSYDNNIIITIKSNKNKNTQIEIQEKTMAKIQFGRVSKSVFDEYDEEMIKLGLFSKYPQLWYYTQLARNFKVESDWFKYKFEPNIDAKARKIGIRATTRFMSMPTKKNHPEIVDKPLREDYLDSFYGKDNWVEYDIKGSVPRISRLTKLGIVEDLNHDPYADMYKQWFNENDDEGWTEDKRKMMKTIFMHLFFDRSVSEVIHHLNYVYDTDRFSSMKTELYELKELTDEYCGKNDNTEVFLHESCIYMDVYKELLSRGIHCIQVYDAFYMAKGDLPSDIDSIVYRCMREYVGKWCH